MNSKVLVWDLPIRVIHWLLVIAFTVAYVTEGDWLTAHVWAGYLIIALLLFRIIWGFIGSRYARFKQFLCSPSSSINYLKQVNALTAKRYLGHNPASALMIVLMLLSLLLTTLSGLVVYAANQGAGPLAGIIALANEGLWEEVHEFFANFSVVLIIIHLLGVIFESYVHNENLIKSMWNGYKDRTGEDFDDME